MGAEAEGKQMIEMIIKYRRRRPVEESDRHILDNLHRASIISYSVRDGVLRAEAAPAARRLRFKPWKLLGSGKGPGNA